MTDKIHRTDETGHLLATQLSTGRSCRDELSMHPNIARAIESYAFAIATNVLITEMELSLSCHLLLDAKVRLDFVIYKA